MAISLTKAVTYPEILREIARVRKQMEVDGKRRVGGFTGSQKGRTSKMRKMGDWVQGVWEREEVTCLMWAHGSVAL